MNTGTLDMLTTYERAGLRATVTKLVEDTELGAESVTFRARGGRGYDAGSGIVSNSETPTVLTATLSPLSEQEIAATDGARKGDATILIAVSALATPPRVDDRITTATDTYHVVNVDQIGVGSHYRLLGRKA